VFSGKYLYRLYLCKKIGKLTKIKWSSVMAFINEYISEEDIQKYGIRQEWDKFHPFSKNDLNLLKKHSWTVDKERDVFFIAATSGREELSNQVTCILWWKGVYLSVTLSHEEGGLDYQKSQGNVVWQLLNIWKPKDFIVPDVEIIPVLKEALIVYRYAGIRIPIDDYKVEFKF
jgi:hypothetical protein